MRVDVNVTLKMRKVFCFRLIERVQPKVDAKNKNKKN
jgi:hypothetical protein